MSTETLANRSTPCRAWCDWPIQSASRSSRPLTAFPSSPLVAGKGPATPRAICALKTIAGSSGGRSPLRQEPGGSSCRIGAAEELRPSDFPFGSISLSCVPPLVPPPTTPVSRCSRSISAGFRDDYQSDAAEISRATKKTSKETPTMVDTGRHPIPVRHSFASETRIRRVQRDSTGRFFAPEWITSFSESIRFI